MLKKLIALLWFIPLLGSLTIMPAAIKNVQDEITLQKHGEYQTVNATVTNKRVMGGRQSLEVQYKFEWPENSGHWYSASDVTGRQNLWMETSTNTWGLLENGGTNVRVNFLPQNPSINQPSDMPGAPVADAYAGIFMILMVDFITVLVGLWRWRVANYYPKAGELDGTLVPTVPIPSSYPRVYSYRGWLRVLGFIFGGFLVSAALILLVWQMPYPDARANLIGTTVAIVVMVVGALLGSYFISSSVKGRKLILDRDSIAQTGLFGTKRLRRDEIAHKLNIGINLELVPVT